MGQEPEPVAGQEPASTDPAAKTEPKTYDENYVKGLRNEAAANRTKANELQERIDALEARDMSESEKLAQERDRLKSEVDPVRTENLRLRVAIDKKLPADLVDRLRGNSQEELAADADKLLALVGTPAEPPPDFDGGVRQQAPKSGDMNGFIRAGSGKS